MVFWLFTFWCNFKIIHKRNRHVWIIRTQWDSIIWWIIFYNKEIKKNGVIKNATNIPFHTFLDTFKKNTKLDNKKKYLLYCAVGQRSSLALQVMQSYGFKDSYHLIGGIKEWIKKNNPLELDHNDWCC